MIKTYENGKMTVIFSDEEAPNLFTELINKKLACNGIEQGKMTVYGCLHEFATFEICGEMCSDWYCKYCKKWNFDDEWIERP